MVKMRFLLSEMQQYYRRSQNNRLCSSRTAYSSSRLYTKRDWHAFCRTSQTHCALCN